METARSLGSRISDQATFQLECEQAFGRDTVLCKEFQQLGRDLFRQHDVFVWANDHIWNSRLRIAFFLQRPLNLQLVKIHSDPSIINAHVLTFLDRVIEHHQNLPSVACSILPALTQTLMNTPHEVRYCTILGLLASVKECRPLMQDDTLFFFLSTKLHTCEEHILPLSRHFVHTSHPTPIFREILRRMEHHYIEIKNHTWHRRNEQCHTLIDLLLSMEYWRTVLQDDILLMTSTLSILSMECLGYVYARLLNNETGSSLLVHLHNTSKLSFFLRHCLKFKENGEETWKIIWNRVCIMWPSEVEKRMNVLVPRSAPSSTFSCPITLEAYKVPVVAQDGNTYEMDAILTHFATNGLSSPLTNMKLRAVLLDNFVVKNL